MVNGTRCVDHFCADSGNTIHHLRFTIYQGLRRPGSQVAMRSACYNSVTLNPAGIYIHIPFCRSRCSYCDFATGIYNVDTAERYVAALAREIDSYTEASIPPHI